MKIITLTLSPAIDITYSLGGEICLGLNRAASFSESAGGKGINVCRAIIRESIKCGIDADVISLYPRGGASGELLYSMLSGEGIPSCAIPTDEPCRVNVSAIDVHGRDIEINSKGAKISPEEICKIENALSVLSFGDVLAICGSVPDGIDPSYYSELIQKMKSRGVTCILDCDGEPLRLAMCAPIPPDYIKPNDDELKKLCAALDVEDSAEDLATRYPGTAVIATYGEDGASIVRSTDRGNIKIDVNAEKVKPVRIKGAGDTLLGAFMYHKFVLFEDDENSLRAAVTTASEYVGGEEKAL